MNILVTGGAGFIGSEIVNQLHGKHNVTVIDAMTKQIHGENWQDSYLYKQIDGKCKFYKGDVRDTELMIQLVKDNNDVVIHLAAETGTGQSMYMINQYNDVNIMGTSNLLQAISSSGKDSKVKKIILSSSRSVYGEGKYQCPKCGTVYPKGRERERMLYGDFGMYCTCGKRLNLVPTTEDSKLSPSSLYAFTKCSQEMMLETMCESLDLNYTIFRFQNVYGVGQSLKNPYTGILSIFSTLMLEDKPINIFEDGMESRDFVNVKDIAKAVIRSIDEDKSNGEIINLGSGVGTSVIDIAGTLKEIYGSKSEIKISGDFRLGDIAHNVADIKRAKEILHYKPEITLKEGLSDFCTWVRGEDNDNSGYENSLSEMEASGMFIRKCRCD